MVIRKISHFFYKSGANFTYFREIHFDVLFVSFTDDEGRIIMF